MSEGVSAAIAVSGTQGVADSPPANSDGGAVFDRSVLIGANINPDTLLATDYLNHFNEVGMLLEMLPEMPDCIQELEDWQPRSYVDHFTWSGLRYADLAVEAYNAAQPTLRNAFEDVIGRLNQLVLEAIPQARHAIDSEDPGEIYISTTNTAKSIRALIDEAGGIINGVGEVGGVTTDAGNAQDAINALFD